MDLPDELLHLRGRRGGENAMAAVIGDDDLLREILLRLGFPAFLIHAALVSKRWLRVATDTVFLRRFRELNQTHLNGILFGVQITATPPQTSTDDKSTINEAQIY